MRKKTLILALMALLSLPTMAQLPALTLKDVNGRTVSTDTLCNQGPVILDFFATWCHPCKRELNAIAEVYDEWQEETGVRLIAVSIDRAQDVNKVKPLADGSNWPYEVLLDTNSDLKRALNVQMVPSVFIFDKTGKQVYSHSGYADGEEEELIEKVKELAK